jgi:DNA-binding transcriptional LysR family regulator
METTSTQISVRMVEAGLGLAIVPLLASGVVTRGCRVGVRSLGEQIRPIDSGILLRSGETLSPAAQEFAEFIERHCRK